jgi:RimJ/RimL family protein N-acetyltransferase
VDLSGLEVDTHRMRLRPYRLDDLDAFADLHGRDDVARYLPWVTRDAAASEAALHRHLGMRLDQDGDGVTLAGIHRDSGRLVGEFVLFLRSIEHRGGEVGYVLHPDFQGQGLATEGALVMLELGFERLRMHRIIARIDARNEPSARVLSRLRMRKEAHLVQNELFKGEWSDEADYAMLASEWSSSTARSAISWNSVAPAAASVPGADSPPAKP